MARDRPLRVIVDTNVVAYYLLATEPFVEEVRTFWHRPLELAAPALWEAEVSNVLWMAARKGVIDKRMALLQLGLAARLGIAEAVHVSMVPANRLLMSVEQTEHTFELKVEGEKLTGKAFFERMNQKGEAELLEGKVSGNDIFFVEKISVQGNELRVEYKGKVSGDEISFTRKTGDIATVQFVAKRVKD